MVVDENKIFNLTPEKRNEMIEAIIDKASIDKNNTGKNRKTKWKDREFVRNIVLEYLRVLTVSRNVNIDDIAESISEGEALDILYTNFNFRNKINPQKAQSTFEVLDKFMTKGEANQVFKAFPKITTGALDELRKKLELLTQYGYLQNVISDPQKLRGSLSWISERLAYYNAIIQSGKEQRKITEIPASELLSAREKHEIDVNSEKKSEEKEEVSK